MSQATYTNHLSVSITPEMDRYLEELARVRTRKDKPVSKAHLIREAIRLYLDQQDDLHGSRRKIAKSVEGKLESVWEVAAQVAEGMEKLNVQVGKQNDFLVRMGQVLQSLIARFAER